ncbi:MAG: OmpA family protein [Bdellovibrionaceae bacterium]|nr:OmpA family protein [Pseudobdellovibrionaceae bacterium]
MSLLKLSFLIGSLLFANFSRANVLGTDAQNFNPTTNGLDFVTVHSSATLDPGIVNIGFFLNYAVNSLPYVYGVGGSAQSRTRFSDRLLSSDLNFGLGIKDNWDVGVSFPYLWSQKIDDDGLLGRYGNTGATGQRINTKYRFYRGEEWSWAAIASVDQSLIENNPYTGEGPRPTYNLEFASDVMVKNILFGFNLGHRWRHPGTSLAATYGISPLPNQWIYSVAGSYLMPSLDTKVIWELFGSYPSSKHESATIQNASDRERSSLETLIGLKWDKTTNLAFHFGGGTEIYHGTGTPAWRIYSGVNYAFGPVWGQKSSLEATAPPNESTIEKPPAKVQNFTLTFLRFKFDSTELDPSSYKNLDIVVKMIRETPGVQKVVIEGHTDSVGSHAYNLTLSQKRAAAVKDYLKERLPELSKVDFKAEGYGPDRPIESNANYQGRARNRRVVVRVTRKTMGADRPDVEESSITF